MALSTLISPALAQEPSGRSRPQTDKSTLDALALRLQAKFLEGRGPAYRELLRSTDPAQVALNRSEDKELMYVTERGIPRYYEVHNLTAARTVSTRPVWPGQGYGHSLTGAGTALGELGVWDGGGVLTTHQEFGGRVTQIDSPGGTHYHATHVAGTMIAAGVVSSAKGMSYEANLAAYDWSNDESEMASAAASGMNVSNHSYGYVAGWDYDGDWYWYGDLSVSTTEDWKFGFYDSHARDWDEISYDAPYYTIVSSAGNHRNDIGPGGSGYHYHWDGGWVWDNDHHEIDGGADHYDCLSSPETAKNIIVVGAVNDIYDGYTQPSDVAVTSFSSWGPTDDGRIKPDLVANGQGLYSTHDTGDTEYTTLSGTSMSSPNLAGSLNLLVRHYEDTHGGTTPLSSTMKALTIQTADEAGDYTGPDYMHGWGLLNTLHAADEISADAETPTIIKEDFLADAGGGDSDTLYFYSDGIDPIRLTLAWTDPEGSPPASYTLNPTTLMLVNDLDLRVVYEGGPTTHLPYVLDPSNPANAATTGDNTRDNVEQVYIGSPAAGSYMAIVSHKGNLSGDQWYSLVSSRPMDAGGHDSTPPVTAVATPNGGEDWTVGTVHDITWTATDAHGIDYVDILYSVDGGASYSPVASGEANDSTYSWTVPNAPGDSAVVKVIAYDPWANAAGDTSDAFFTISPPPDTTDPAVEVTAPDGGETWYAGLVYDVTWSASDDSGVDSVSVYYSTNGGADFELVAAEEPNDGGYAWTVPSTPTATAVVKVIAYDPSLNQGEDVSDGVFEIAMDTEAPVATVVAPDGGDTLKVAESCDIKWSAYDPTFAATDDFADGDDVGWSHWCYNPTCNYTVSGGVYEVQADPGPAISTLDATNGWSDYMFEADVRIDSGDTRAVIFRFVDWDTYYKVRLLPARAVLTRHTLISTETLATAPGQSFTTGVWYHVSILAGGADIKVSVDGQELIDVTDPDPILSGAAGVSASSSHTAFFDNVVAASPSDIQSVSILYSTDGGATFPHSIATGEPNDGVFPWTVPDTPSDSALVKVVAYDMALNEGEDSSDTLFTIEGLPDTVPPAVTVLTPDKGDSLETGATYDITWTATDAGGVDSVSIYYSSDGGGQYSLIASGEINDGLYPWYVPAAPTDSAMVKVIAYDPSLNAGTDESDSLNVVYEPTVGLPGDRHPRADAVRLWQNAPNPFSPGTSISFYLPKDGPVFLEIFDAKGRRVDVLVDGKVHKAGVTTVPWSAEGLGSGVYFYRLKAGGEVKTKKMVVAR